MYTLLLLFYFFYYIIIIDVVVIIIILLLLLLFTFYPGIIIKVLILSTCTLYDAGTLSTSSKKDKVPFRIHSTSFNREAN